MRKTCTICRKEFNGRKKQIFCSPQCLGISRRGVPRPPEVRQKISNAHRGMKFSDEHRKNLSMSKKRFFASGGHPWNYGKKCPQITANNKKLGLMPPEANRFRAGSDHPSWKGGISSERTKIYNSAKYKNWRKKVFERDNYICQECGATNGLGKTVFLQAHHLKSFSKYPELRFKTDNGLTLCFGCHNLTKRGRFT